MPERLKSAASFATNTKGLPARTVETAQRRGVGDLVSSETINQSEEAPVRLLRVKQPSALGPVEPGHRVSLSLPHTAYERPFVIIGRSASSLDFAVRVDAQDQFSQKLGRLKPGASLVLSGPQAPPPIPCIPTVPELVVLVAEGMSVTGLIHYLADCSRFAMGAVLLWQLRSEDDLFLVEELREWSNEEWLRVVLFYTQFQMQYAMGTALRRDSLSPRKGKGDFTSNPIEGKVSGSTILDAFSGAFPVDPRDSAWIVSGSEGFVEIVTDALADLAVPPERIASLDQVTN